MDMQNWVSSYPLVSDDLTQQLHVDVKKDLREYWVLQQRTKEQLWAGSLAPYQHQLELTAEKRTKPTQHCTTQSQPWQPDQKDTMVDGIKNHWEVKEDENGCTILSHSHQKSSTSGTSAIFVP